MKNSTIRPVSFLAAMTLTTVGLLFGWCSAASASEGESKADVTFEVEVVTGQAPARQPAMRCWRQPLANGKPGERVLVCDVPAPSACYRVGAHKVVCS
jgi:hypothetical protein